MVIMISIHAPARGATFIVICMAAINLISIHAPARGATGCQIPPALLPTLFQSTLPQGERRQWGASAEMGVKISIHAPARGATDCRRLKSIQFAISIHAPARGATGLEDFIASITAYFNPRSRKGSDMKNWRLGFILHRFQSTLPQGERPTPGAEAGPHRLFQSTLPQGERQIYPG